MAPLTPSKSLLQESSSSFETPAMFSLPEKNKNKNNIKNHHGRERRVRVRGHTLVPGSMFHEAFFGSDNQLRLEFDQDAAITAHCNNRQLLFVSHGRQESSSSSMDDSSSSSSSSSITSQDSSSIPAASSFKQGRPMLPRYGSF